MKFPLLPLESLNKESFSKIGLRSWLFRKWLGDPVQDSEVLLVFPEFPLDNAHNKNGSRISHNCGATN